MNVYVVLLNLTGAVGLLLWAVRMVRTGVERSQEPALRRLISDGKHGRLRIAAVGAGVAILLQSSTAVAMLAAGFTGSGALSLSSGLALMLGADLGSALVVQLLSVDLHWLVPALLVVGSAMFFKGPTRQWRQGGRIIIGIGLILISLRMVGEATLPLREAPFLTTALNYLRTDFVTAFLLAALFTWLVHSSVASVLMIVAFAAQQVVPLELGVSLILGANLGGGLIAVGLTRHGTLPSRRIALGNCLFRGLGAVLVLVPLQLLDPSLGMLGPDSARQLINLHLVFNLLLLVTCLPLTGTMERLVSVLLRVSRAPGDPLTSTVSCLDASLIGNPVLAVASAKRELLRMAEIIERMLTPLMELYGSGDLERIREVKRLDDAVNRAQSEIKLYLSQIEYPEGMDDVAESGNRIATYAINLEHVGDAISKTLMKLAETRRDQNLKFSPQGWRELNELHHLVVQNMTLALNVLMSGDHESARLLISEKEAVHRAERASAKQHLVRLRQRDAQSVATSNLHLETVRALRTISSLFASVAYPILADPADRDRAAFGPRHP